MGALLYFGPQNGNNASATGTFTAVDAVVAAPAGDGSLLSGTSTAGSYVALAVPDAMVSWVLLLKNYTTGTVYTEASVNSTNGIDGDWIELKGSRTGTTPSTETVAYAYAASGYYRGNISGFTYIRARYLGPFTAGMSAKISLAFALGPTFIISPLPAGANVIGKVGIDQTTPGTTNAVQVIGSLPKTTDGTTSGTLDVTSTASAVSLAVGGYATIGINITGTWVGQLYFEYTLDGTNWFQVYALPAAQGSGNLAVFATNGNGNWRVPVSGFLTFRVRVASAGSGTAAVILIANTTAAPVMLPVPSAKGIQTGAFLPVQDAKDSGRVTVALTLEVAGTQTAELLATMTESRDGAAITTFTSKVITSGKRLRFTCISMEVETLGSGTAPQRMYLRLRVNTAGVAVAGSPIQGVWAVVNSTAIVKSGNMMVYDIPDGIEFLGNGTTQYGFTIQFPDWVATTGTVQGKITVIGFEY